MFNTGFPPTWSTLRKLMILKAATLKQAYATFTGTIARFLSPSSKPVKSIVCNIEPVQDLHGYDNPWPAGGGTNILPLKDGTYTLGATGVTVTVSNSVISFSGTAVSGGGRTVKLTDDFTLAAGTYFIKTNSDSDATIYINNANTNAAINTGDNRSFTLSEDTSVYAGVNVVSGTAYASKKANPTLNVGNAAQPFAPYSNLCPISGFTGLNVYGTGKNLLPNPLAYSSKGVLSKTDGIFLKAGKYTIAFDSVNATNWRYFIKCFNADGTILFTGNEITGIEQRGTLQGYLSSSNVTYKALTFTLNLDCSVSFAMMFGDLSASSVFTASRLNFGSTAEPYEAYVGTTLPVSWQSEAGTVYAGYLSIDKDGGCTLTGTHGKVTFDANNMPTKITEAGMAAALGGKTRILLEFSPMSRGGGASVVDALLCDKYKTISAGAMYTGVMGCSLRDNVKTGFYIYNPDIQGVEAWTTEIQTNGITFCYPLATPVTYTLSSVTVPSTVQGENNWWHDANGNITIEAIGTPISSDEPDALQSLNILLGGAYTPRANFSEPTDEQALNIIMGGSR